MKFIKKHKLLMLGLLILITVGVLLLIFINMFFRNNDSITGNRLEGIEEVRIDNITINDIENSIKEVNGVLSADYKLNGRKINLIVKVDDTVDKAKAKSFGDKIVKKLTDEQKKYYDIQLFVDSDTNKEIYPVIGYKNKNSLNFSWTEQVGGLDEK